MPKTNIQNLEAEIRRSPLLSEDRREALLRRLSSLTPALEEKLLATLAEATTKASFLVDRMVSVAMEKGDTQTLIRLDRALTDMEKKLRKAEEGVERAGEEGELNHHFDDADS